MATTPPPLDARAQALSQAYRSSQLGLRATTIRSVVSLWPLLRFDDVADSYGRWQEALRLLVERDRRTGYAITAGYLTGAYLAAGREGTPDIPPATPLEPERFETSVRVTSLVAYRRGLSLGMTTGQAAENALVQVSGSASRLVLDASRSTLIGSARANNARWARLTSSAACNFCKLLAGRGYAYHEDTVGFDAHDHCGCTGAVDFSAASRAA